jgi:hypothetical protein
VVGGVDMGVERTIWMAYYNTGTATIELREGDLLVGGMQNVGSSTSLNVLAYIGSPNESDSTPIYSTADGPVTTNSFVTDGNNLTQSIKRLDKRAGLQQEIVNQQFVLINGGDFTWNAPTLTWSATANVQVAGLADSVNTIPAGSVALNDGDVAYVILNRTGPGGNLTVFTANIAALPVGDDVRFIARRSGTDLYVGETTLIVNTTKRALYDGGSGSLTNVMTSAVDGHIYVNSLNGLIYQFT